MLQDEVKRRDHHEYLLRVWADNNISTEVFNDAIASWKAVDTVAVFKLPVPYACTGPNGEMEYCWDNDTQLLSLEIELRNREFFFRDRVADFSWLERWNEDALPPRVLEVLPLFYRPA